MYDRAAVTVRELLSKFQLQRYGLRNELAGALEETSKAACNECVARVREVDAVAVLNSSWT